MHYIWQRFHSARLSLFSLGRFPPTVCTSLSLWICHLRRRNESRERTRKLVPVSIFFLFPVPSLFFSFSHPRLISYSHEQKREKTLRNSFPSFFNAPSFTSLPGSVLSRTARRAYFAKLAKIGRACIFVTVGAAAASSRSRDSLV